MQKNSLSGVVTATLLLLCLSAPAQARTFELSLKPSVFQSILTAAGTYSEIIASDPDTGYSCSVYIPYIKGATVTVGFPSAGLRREAPFLLEINGIPATVTYSKAGKLAILDGDERMAATGIFGTLECLFSEVFTMVADFFAAIFSLNILGALEAIVSGILGVIICILY
jgi:hypothetical protein